MRSILFVCLGNICRSPLAEAILRDKAEAAGVPLDIDSAGTGSWHIGEAPCARSIAIAARYGLDIRALRARQVSREDADRFDLVVGLDAQNVADLEAMGFNNVIKLGVFGHKGEDVPDPYFFPDSDGFDAVFKMIASCCEGLLASIRVSKIPHINFNI